MPYWVNHAGLEGSSHTVIDEMEGGGVSLACSVFDTEACLICLSSSLSR